MSQMCIFLSHSHEDNAFCETLVEALRGAGADVWFDEHNLRAVQLFDVISRELHARPVFIVVLSKAAFTSTWVRDECQWAYQLYKREPNRIILPVVAQSIAAEDFNTWLFLEAFRRVEAPGGQPYSVATVINETLDLLTLTAEDKVVIPAVPRSGERVRDLVAHGKALYAKGQYLEALPFLKEATERAPRNFDAWASLGGTQLEVERFEEALAVYNHLLSSLPAPANATSWHRSELFLMWCEKAFALNALNQFKEALAAADEALAIDSGVPTPWLRRGHALGKLERHEEALLAFERALTLNGTDSGTWLNKAQALTYLKRYDEALVAFEHASDLKPNDGWAWNGKGYVFLQVNRLQDALRCFNRAVELAPSEGMYWAQRGETYFALRRYEEALLNYNHAVLLAPRNPIYWADKARALRALKRVAEAEEAERHASGLGG